MTTSSLYIQNCKCFLLNKFPHIEESILMAIFTENGSHLIPTCLFLRSGMRNPFSFVWMNKQIRMLPIPRNRMNDGVEKDGVFLDEVKSIEREEEEERERRDHSIRSHAAFKRQKYKGAHIQECPLCAEEFLEDDMIICSFRHNVCKRCLKDCIGNSSKNFQPKTSCFADANCKGCYSDMQLKRALSEKELNDFYQKLIQFEIGRANLDGLFACPDCAYQIIANKEAVLVICLQCKKDWCLICNRRSHGKEICPRKLEEGKTALARYVEDVLDKKFTRRCATCKKPVIKEGGCDWVGCTCGGCLCWRCGIALTNADHNNYGGPGNHFSTCRGITETWEQVKARAEAEWKQSHPGYF